ncbi:MAG: hypothetical protein ACR2LQ_04770 [Acidimicrobiales bacterium]
MTDGAAELDDRPPPPTLQTPPVEIAVVSAPDVAAGIGVRVGCALLEMILFVAGLGVGWIIWWVALWSRGSSPARSILHLELVRSDGSGASRAGRTAARELLAKVLLALAPISAAVWLVGHRGIWDRATGTTIVRREPALAEPVQSGGGW